MNETCLSPHWLMLDTYLNHNNWHRFPLSLYCSIKVLRTRIDLISYTWYGLLKRESIQKIIRLMTLYIIFLAKTNYCIKICFTTVSDSMIHQIPVAISSELVETTSYMPTSIFINAFFFYSPPSYLLYCCIALSWPHDPFRG